MYQSKWNCIVALLFVPVMLWGQSYSIGSYDATGNYKSGFPGPKIDSLLLSMQNAHTFNILDYGAPIDGLTDARPAIQSTINAASASGGTVYIPAGTFLLTGSAHPLYPSATTCLYVNSNVKIVGAGGGQTVLKRAAAQSEQQSMLMNYHYGVSLDSNIVIQDIVFDGNGQNNPVSADHAQYGINFNRAKFCSFDRVWVKNVIGTGGSGGTGESACFEGSMSDHFSYVDCVAGGWPTSSSGFSYDGGSFVKYINCTAYSFGVANGFTHNNIRNALYSNCVSIGNADKGFNSEVSGDIEYVNCIGGAKGVSTATGSYSAYQNLGNHFGFLINDNSGPVNLTNCIGDANIEQGVFLVADTFAVTINGGSFSHNGTYGIQYETTSLRVSVLGAPSLDSNTTAPIRINGVNYSSTSTTSAYNQTYRAPFTVSGTTTLQGSGAVASMRDAGGTAGMDFRMDGTETQPTAGLPWIMVGGSSMLLQPGDTTIGNIYINHTASNGTVIFPAQGSPLFPGNVIAYAPGGVTETYFVTQPKRGRQSGVVLCDSTTPKWGIFSSASPVYRFEIYNYHRSNQAVIVDTSSNMTVAGNVTATGAGLFSNNIGWSGAAGEIPSFAGPSVDSLTHRKFVIGSLMSIDSSMITTATKLPMDYLPYGAIVDTVIYCMAGGSTPNITPKIMWGTDISATGTALITSPSAITSNSTVTKVSTFDNATITAGCTPWLTFTGTSSKPWKLTVTLIGRYP